MLLNVADRGISVASEIARAFVAAACALLVVRKVSPIASCMNGGILDVKYRS
jgi:predicted phosphoribosyltransferase